jgi:hypothetical protein
VVLAYIKATVKKKTINKISASFKIYFDNGNFELDTTDADE